MGAAVVEEQEQFIILLQKMQGRWVEPRPSETTVVVERLSTNPGGMVPHDRVMRSMELFAERVMPHFAD